MGALSGAPIFVPLKCGSTSARGKNSNNLFVLYHCNSIICTLLSLNICKKYGMLKLPGLARMYFYVHLFL